jgi:hypothetical protein
MKAVSLKPFNLHSTPVDAGFAVEPAAGTADTHWVEVVDSKALYPAKLLGPYVTAQLADRGRRGVMRLLNMQRYAVAVVSQQQLAARSPAAQIG